MTKPVPNEEGLRALERAAGAPADDGPVANQHGLEELGRQVEAAAPRRGFFRRHRRLSWTVGVMASVFVLLAAGVVGYAYYLNSKVQRVAVKGLTDGPAKGADAGTENILMVGSTSRCALTVQNPAYGLCSQGVTGVNSDVVMILHLNPSVPSVSILSIPRDLFIPNARADGANKIDAALVEGPSQLVAAIEEDFGIPIQHYVELNFDSFANVVDALGGINMYFPEPVYDQYSGLNVMTPGCHHLDGIEALQVVRARHLQYKGPGTTSPYPQYWPQEAQSDIARIRRDHEFLRVLAAAVAAKGLGDPFTDQQLVAGVVGQLTVDSGFSASHMAGLVLTYHGVNIHNAPELTVPVAVDQFGNYVYQGGDYGDIEFPVQPSDQQVVDQFLGLSPTTDTMNGGPLPSAADVTVSVLNGTGVTDQATTTGAALGQLGFKVVGLGDTNPVGQQAETVVTYAHMTPTDEAAAQAVARSISGAVIMALGPTTDGAEVTVTTGTEFSVNPPPATTTTGPAGATTSAPAGGTTSTIPSTTTTTNGDFSTPTQPVEALAPWDPRSCTPSGGEGA